MEALQNLWQVCREINISLTGHISLSSRLADRSTLTFCFKRTHNGLLFNTFWCSFRLKIIHSAFLLVNRRKILEYWMSSCWGIVLEFSEEHVLQGYTARYLVMKYLFLNKQLVFKNNSPLWMMCYIEIRPLFITNILTWF